MRFVTNFHIKESQTGRLTFRLAGLLSGRRIEIRKDHYDKQGRKLSNPSCRSLFVKDNDDISDFWKQVDKLEAVKKKIRLIFKRKSK